MTVSMFVILYIYIVHTGSGHVFALKQMIQRAYQQRLGEHRSQAAATTTATVSAAGSPSSNSSRKASINGGGSPHRSASKSISDSPRGNAGKQLSGVSQSASLAEEPAPTSHFKQSYLINKLLFPAETDVPKQQQEQDTAATTPRNFVDQREGEEDEEGFLLREMVDYADVLGITHSELFVNNAALGAPVVINPFIERLLLHGKLSYDEIISGVMAPSMAEVALTTWTLQVPPIRNQTSFVPKAFF